MRYLALFTILSTCFVASVAQEPATEHVDSVYTIIQSIETEGNITIVQEPALNGLVDKGDGQLVSSRSRSSSRQGGYRIQVFSDNNMRTAKANAEYRKRSIEQRFPSLKAYLTYDAPYWRVRVGDYRTRVEADAAMRDIKNAFPAFANDVRLVRERINASH